MESPLATRLGAILARHTGVDIIPPVIISRVSVIRSRVSCQDCRTEISESWCSTSKADLESEANSEPRLVIDDVALEQ